MYAFARPFYPPSHIASRNIVSAQIHGRVFFSFPLAYPRLHVAYRNYSEHLALVCTAYSIYPEAGEMRWRNNKTNVSLVFPARRWFSPDLRPSGDGTYQTQIYVNVSPVSTLHDYECCMLYKSFLITAALDAPAPTTTLPAAAPLTTSPLAVITTRAGKSMAFT